MKVSIFSGLMLCLLMGCSNKSLYNTGQEHRKNDCIKEAQNSQDMNQCLNDKPQPYEDYELERQKAIDGKSN